MRPSRSFSLMEAAMALMIFMVLTSGAAVVVSGAQAEHDAMLTANHLGRVEQALLDYMQKNGRLPCPADATRPNNDPTLGQEAEGQGRCIGGFPAANFFSPGGGIAYGFVPFATLGLPADAARDAWGRRLMYAVVTRATARDELGELLAEPQADAIVLRDEAQNNKHTDAAFVLLSYGQNGLGAFLPDGARRISALAPSAIERENCVCGGAGRENFRGIFYQPSGASEGEGGSDDLLRYVRLPQLPRAEDKP